jgi:hypothetical protein
MQKYAVCVTIMLAVSGQSAVVMASRVTDMQLSCWFIGNFWYLAL